MRLRSSRSPCSRRAARSQTLRVRRRPQRAVRRPRAVRSLRVALSSTSLLSMCAVPGAQTGSAVVTFVAMGRSSYLSVVPVFSRREVLGALALVDVAYSAEGVEPFAERVVEALAPLVPGEIVGYNERELLSHRLLTAREAPFVDPPRDVVDAVSTFCGEYPLSMLKRRSETRPLKISDFMSSRELHRLDYYDHALRPMGIEHQMRFWLSAPPGIARYFYVSRGRAHGDFSERERPDRPGGRDPRLGRTREDEPGDRCSPRGVAAHRSEAPRARVQEAAGSHADGCCRSRLRIHELMQRGADAPSALNCLDHLEAARLPSVGGRD